MFRPHSEERRTKTVQNHLSRPRDAFHSRPVLLRLTGPSKPDVSPSIHQQTQINVLGPAEEEEEEDGGGGQSF